ncbi:MAG: hypothetical protein AAFQ42_11950 [Pseudomonadota bacterium]
MLLPLFLAACSEPPADLTSTTTFEGALIAFELPGNWTAEHNRESVHTAQPDDNSQTAPPRFELIEVSSPGFMYLAVSAGPAATMPSLEEWSRDFVTERENALPFSSSANSLAVSRTEGPPERRTLLVTSRDTLFGFVSHASISRFERRRIGDVVAITTLFIAEEDLERVEAGFSRVTNTL